MEAEQWHQIQLWSSLRWCTKKNRSLFVPNSQGVAIALAGATSVRVSLSNLSSLTLSAILFHFIRIHFPSLLKSLCLWTHVFLFLLLLSSRVSVVTTWHWPNYPQNRSAISIVRIWLILNFDIERLYYLCLHCRIWHCVDEWWFLKVLRRDIPWETYMSTKLISGTTLQLLRRYDHQSESHRAQLLNDVICLFPQKNKNKSMLCLCYYIGVNHQNRSWNCKAQSIWSLKLLIFLISHWNWKFSINSY